MKNFGAGSKKPGCWGVASDAAVRAADDVCCGTCGDGTTSERKCADVGSAELNERPGQAGLGDKMSERGGKLEALYKRPAGPR